MATNQLPLWNDDVNPYLTPPVEGVTTPKPTPQPPKMSPSYHAIEKSPLPGVAMAELRFTNQAGAELFWGEYQKLDSSAKIFFSYPSMRGTHTLKVQAKEADLLNFLKACRGLRCTPLLSRSPSPFTDL